MIERFIENDMKLRQWRRFKQNRLAVCASIALLIISFFSLTAEFWANSKPLVLSYNSQLYFPVLKDYHPTEFGVTTTMVTNYRDLQADWALWPLIEWDPYESDKTLEFFPGPPSAKHLMGTDEGGRDVLSRLLYGYRYSMAYAILVWLVTTMIAIVLGGAMGYIGGTVDILGQRVTEVISSIPFLFILIIMVSIYQPGLTLLVIITSFFGWIFMSAYIRGEFLKNRKKEFVEAARAIGASHKQIVFKHILPNSLQPVITFAPFVIATYVTSLAGLDYLGLGLPPPTPSWGELLAQAQKHFTTSWWLAVYPSTALFCTLVLLSLVGDGVREALNPR